MCTSLAPDIIPWLLKIGFCEARDGAVKWGASLACGKEHLETGPSKTSITLRAPPSAAHKTPTIRMKSEINSE